MEALESRYDRPGSPERKLQEQPLEEARQRRNSLDSHSGTNEKDLEEVQDKIERLALVYADQAMKKDTYEKRMGILKKRQNDLLKARSNLDPQVKTELGELERTIAYLEKVVDGKAGKLLLTELGIWVDNISDKGIITDFSNIGSWDDPNTLVDFGGFRLGERGPQMRMVDGPVRAPGEVPREFVLQNIRCMFEALNIKVYIFRDRIEIKGFIPTGTITIPDRVDSIEGYSIIPSPS